MARHERTKLHAERDGKARLLRAGRPNQVLGVPGRAKRLPRDRPRADRGQRNLRRAGLPLNERPVRRQGRADRRRAPRRREVRKRLRRHVRRTRNPPRTGVQAEKLRARLRRIRWLLRDRMKNIGLRRAKRPRLRIGRALPSRPARLKGLGRRAPLSRNRAELLRRIRAKPPGLRQNRLLLSVRTPQPKRRPRRRAELRVRNRHSMRLLRSARNLQRAPSPRLPDSLRPMQNRSPRAHRDRLQRRIRSRHRDLRRVRRVRRQRREKLLPARSSRIHS